MSWTSEKDKRNYEDIMKTINAPNRFKLPDGKVCPVCECGVLTNNNGKVENFDCGHTVKINSTGDSDNN